MNKNNAPENVTLLQCILEHVRNECTTFDYYYRYTRLNSQKKSNISKLQIMNSKSLAFENIGECTNRSTNSI